MASTKPAIFIDIDNTLLDFNAYVRETMEVGFARFGLKNYEPCMYDIFKTENDKLWRQIEKGELVFDELKKIRWRNIFKVLDIDFDGPTFESYFRAALYDSAIPMPGAMELLEKLCGRYILCAASNGPYEQQLHRLEIAGMREHLDYVFISEKMGASKPAEQFFERAFEELNAGRNEEDRIAPERTVMLGDSLTSDMAGGRAYGMNTCYYLRGKAIDAADSMACDKTAGNAGGSEGAHNAHIGSGTVEASGKWSDVDIAAAELADVPDCIEKLLNIKLL